MLDALVYVATSFAGSMLALVVWFHYDLDARWQQHKINHGKHLDERKRK